MLTPVASARVWASSTASTKTEVSGLSGAVVPKGRFQSPAYSRVRDIQSKVEWRRT